MEDDTTSAARAAIEQAQALLRASKTQFSHPVDAMLAHLVTVVVLAKALGVGQEELMDGVRSAWHDLALEPRSVAQEGSSHVH